MIEFFEVLRQYQAFAMAGLTLVAGWFVWSLKNTFATKADLIAQTEINTKQRATMGENIDHLRERVASVEAKIEHMPTRDDFHRLEKGMTELAGVTRANTALLERMEARLMRHEDIFTDAARRK